MTLSIQGLCVTLRITMLCIIISVIMPKVCVLLSVMLCLYSECHYAECLYQITNFLIFTAVFTNFYGSLYKLLPNFAKNLLQ
jgi:hypothetical protein